MNVACPGPFSSSEANPAAASRVAKIGPVSRGVSTVIPRGLQEPLGYRKRDGGPSRQPAGERPSLGQQICGRSEAIDHPPFLQLPGGIDIAGHDEFSGSSDTRPRREPLRATSTRRQSDRRFDQAERGLVSRPQQIAAQGELEADGEVEPMNHGHRWHRQRLHGLGKSEQPGHERSALRGAQALEFMDIDPSTEDVALSPEDDRPRPPVAHERAGLRERHLDVGGGAQIEQIQGRRADDHLCDVSGQLHKRLAHR